MILGFNRYVASLLLLVICANLSAAEANNVKEKFNYGLPKNWELGFHNKTDSISLKEFVPKGTSIKDWEEMASVQITYGGLSIGPESYAQQMKHLWIQSCSSAQFSKTHTGTENGYRFAFWISFCPLLEATSKPEFTLFKAIEGNDSFYVFQKAWRRIPTESEKDTWLNAMRGVYVCDTTIPERACK